MAVKVYTEAEKLAYYKKKAAAGKPGKASYKKVKPSKKPAKRSYAARYVGALGGGALGAAVGGPLGASIGSGLGSIAGDAFHSITGLGEYKIKKNSLFNSNLPRVHNKTHSGETVIRHKEYLGDLITGATGTFNIQSFPVNPGQESTFPFLSQLAVNFEQYRIEGMLFEFRSMSADALNSVNTALGAVIMATNYNAASPNFASKSEMENYEFGNSCKPSSCMLHPIECARMQTSVDELYIRPGSVPSGQDQRLYDIGNFQVATMGFQGSYVNIGEIWITYQVALLKPKMYVALGNYTEYAAILNSTVGNSTPLGTTLQTSYFNNFGLTTSNGFFLNWPQSNIVNTYFVTVEYVGTTGATGSVPVVNSINCLCNGAVSGATGIGPSQFAYAPNLTTFSKWYSACYFVQTLGSGTLPTIGFATTGTLPTGTTNTFISVQQIPNNAYHAIVG